MFNQGAQLTAGLIDHERLFSVMSKVKTLVNNRTKQINYKEIANFTNEITV
jgi:hypothetical protein